MYTQCEEYISLITNILMLSICRVETCGRTSQPYQQIPNIKFSPETVQFSNYCHIGKKIMNWTDFS